MELHRTLDSVVNFGQGEEGPHPAPERHTGVPNASPRLEAVRKGQVGQTGVTDFGPGVERFSGPCAQWK